MTIFRHELRRGRASLALWTACIAALLAVCVALFPEMRGQMDAVGRLFASMGGFTAAFGMDRLNVGTLVGFYCVECGSILGLGGAFYACLTGASALSREERDGTAAFLLTHPVSRARLAAEKLAAVLAQVTVMDAAVLGLALLAVARIGEAIPWREMALLHGACCLMHLELACVCFGISAHLRRGGAGIGMGLAAVMYFLELIANMAPRAGFFKHVTPFAYCGGSDLLAAGRLDPALALPGMALAALGAAAAFWRYGNKDIY